MKHFSFLLLIASAPLVALAAQPTVINQSGDVLAMPDAPAAVVNLPRNGMSKTTVQKRFGAPLRKEPAVGEPPISVWHYDTFKVFFEHQLVLHSVSANRKPVVYNPPQ